MKNSLGFTLAEILITLGIIGVVAALTIPTVVQSYRNMIVESRLKKFYSTFNQSIQIAESEYGDKKGWYTTSQNPNEIDEWFKTYMKALNITKKVIRSDNSIHYYLPDGSNFLVNRYSKTDYKNGSIRIIVFYTGNFSKCEKLEKPLGTCKFSFAYIPDNASSWPLNYNKGLEPIKYGWDGNNIDALKTGLLRSCYDGEGTYCAALIQSNGWKIPKDYPFKVNY